MSEQEKAPPGVDSRVPSVARMYDYYLGGKDNFASDREAAEKVIKLLPHAREIARENRAFLGKAVHVLAESGIRQFIDIGAGLPTSQNVHQVALATVPDARVVYVDNDPIVLAHARALLADNPQTIVIDGDLHEPKAILRHPSVRSHIAFDEPFAVILCAVVHFIQDDDQARSIVAFLRESLPPRGALVLSHGFEGEVTDYALVEAQAVYSQTRGGLRLRGRDAIRDYFSGLDLLEPGLVHVGAWRTDPDFEEWGTVDPSAPGGLGAVGLVPASDA